jgi:hypothetical protein
MQAGAMGLKGVGIGVKLVQIENHRIVGLCQIETQVARLGATQFGMFGQQVKRPDQLADIGAAQLPGKVQKRFGQRDFLAGLNDGWSMFVMLSAGASHGHVLRDCLTGYKGVKRIGTGAAIAQDKSK